MNKTKIEWTDWTWNPMTGCWGPGGTAEKPRRCPYCYAERIAPRVWAMQGRPPIADPFMPMFWPERLDEPRKVKHPVKIFVCSMADLFGDWVPSPWIRAVLEVAEKCPQHTFQFLTKNPKRLSDFNPWPDNCWVGTTITNQADADKNLPWILKVKAPVLFVSHEPLLGEINLQKSVNHLAGLTIPHYHQSKLGWGIIGALKSRRPDSEWVTMLLQQYHAARVPVFLKDNLNYPLRRQEWPT